MRERSPIGTLGVVDRVHKQRMATREFAIHNRREQGGNYGSRSKQAQR
jgi:hypothetical protein